MSKFHTDYSQIGDEAFRLELRGWLEKYYPPEWRRPIVLRLRGDDERRWLRMLWEHGWRLPAWPRDHGGMGLSLAKQMIYHEEMQSFGAARWLDSGGVLLGPVLIRYGSEEQKARYLPEIARGDVIWCQGYSEPEAGSDLASLRTSAVRDRGDWVVNGSKIWTTMVMEADRMFLLARTNRDVKKQQGISFFLVDMDTPGLTRRPILNLADEDEFGEVFFDDVRIPAENLVHEEGAGWSVAKTLLGAERIHSGSPSLARHAFAIFERITAELGLADRAAVADLRARLACDLADLTALYNQIADAAVRGEAENEDFSVLKVLATELFQKTSAGCLQIAGEHAGALGEERIGSLRVDLHKIFMIARPSSIYGGANEVQRDIIARRLLGKAG
jgi:alkylation response protein AidB-like acyl-CoA dehydrogenase